MLRLFSIAVLSWLLLCPAFAETPDAAPPDAWPLARGTVSACGVAGSTLPDRPELLWTFTAENQRFQAGGVIQSGSVYLGSSEGTLYAVDLATGKKRWEYAGKSSYMTAPAVRNGRVLIGDQDGDFACFDAKSGQVLWKYGTDGPIDSPANFYRDRVLFGSEDGDEYCVDAASGKLVWKFDMGDQVRCQATIAGGAPGTPGRGYFATCGAMLYTIDLDKGAALGKVPIDAPTGCAAALGKDRAFVGNEEGQFLAVDLAKGAIAWRYQDRAQSMPYRSSAAVTADGVYVGSRNKKLYAFDPQTGRQLWVFTTRGMIDSSPVVVGNRLFFGSQDGRIYGADRKSGKEVWRYDAGGKIIASPAVAGGRLVIGSDSGKLYCFGK